MDLLRHAMAQGFNYNHVELHQDPDFESLRGYPPYEEFLKPKD